jgi:hypothetical protein
LANGAKHLELNDRRHDSVSFTTALTGWGAGAWGEGAWGAALWVSLQGEAADELGAVIDAVNLAEKVMAYWDAHPLA